ncbi:MAG: aminoacyl-histidine dipeptidase [Cytophagales bacterium]|nr:aminoacyl-histidine dipeptidase [Cytophagales bacterium]
MNSEVIQLDPQLLWENFERLNEVPRPSKKEERVVEFVKNFGESLNLETITDKAGNIIIKKPATPGFEDRKTVALQSHVDMVCQKNADTDFDFDKQGIQSYIDGEWVKAKGTTLGADNGIGVAAAMSILQSDKIEHGPIEALFTVDEETGMTGAFALEAGQLDADFLLNMDTEDEGELTIGCAGGIDTNVTGAYVEEIVSEGVQAFRLTVSGLRGGHSGAEIHMGRGNANKIMNRLLYGSEEFGLRIAAVDGGGLRNAIPRESFAHIVVEDVEGFRKKLEAQSKEINAELNAVEPNLVICMEDAEMPEKVMAAADQKSLVNAVYLVQNGVYRMSDQVDGLVETSNNLSRVLVKNGKIESLCLTRSSVESAKMDLANMIRTAYEASGYQVEQTGSYPGWAPKADSEILEVLKERFDYNFPGETPVVNAVHAGLECGILGRNYPEMEMISFGPTIKNPHSPDEMVKIDTVSNFWNYLLDILKHIPKK